MESRTILILLAIPNFDYDNQNSAVLNYLKVIKQAFEDSGDKVLFYCDLVSQIKKGPEDQKEPVLQQGGIKSNFKKFLRKWPYIYQSLAFRYFFKAQKEMIERIEVGQKIDLIIEFYTVGSNVGVQLSKKWNVPLHLIYDSPVDEQFLEMYKTKTIHWRKIIQSEKETLEFANRVVVYSKPCQQFIENKYKLKAEINVLPCVVFKEQIKRSNTLDGDFIIGFIGSFLKWHKVEVLVSAFHKFHNIYPFAKLYLIGFGEEWEKIKSMVKILGLEDFVYQPGFVKEEELKKIKSELSVAVMPGSNWYGSPLKLFEYTQSEIPFIAPESPTISEIFLPNEHCLYIDKADSVNSLLDHLVFIKENPSEAQQMANCCYNYFNSIFGYKSYQDKIVRYLS